MNWFYWDTGWSFVFGTIAFMTIVGHPDAVVVAYHPGDRAPIAQRFIAFSRWIESLLRIQRLHGSRRAPSPRPSPRESKRTPS